MSQPTISIIGAGIGGLALGRCLLQRGIRTILYEKAPSTSRHSYAITLQPSTYRHLLKALNIEESTFKTRVAVDSAIGGSGTINPDSYSHRNIDSASIRAHRGRFEELLREGLDVRWESALQHITPTLGQDLTLEFTNSESAHSSIVIATDGVHSVTRKQFLPETNPTILPYVAFNGRRKLSREQFDTLYAPSFTATTVLECRSGDTVLNLSISDVASDNVTLSWTYSRPARGSSDALYKPGRSNAAAKETPDAFFTEIAALTDLPQPFSDVFDAEKLRAERVLHWLMRSLLVPRAELHELAAKNVYLLGDAAHAEQIIGGEGANAAIDDAVGLAEWVAEKGVSHVNGWYEERWGEWRDGQRRSAECIAGIHGESVGLERL